MSQRGALDVGQRARLLGDVSLGVVQLAFASLLCLQLLVVQAAARSYPRLALRGLLVPLEEADLGMHAPADGIVRMA